MAVRFVMVIVMAVRVCDGCRHIRVVMDSLCNTIKS